MGLQSALSTALTGLTAAETTIDVVGNNLANSNTVGFKASQASFATQFLQTLSLGSAPTDNTGGTNPRQIGLGTLVADITPNFNQGTLEISSNPTDLAIQGEGFFVVEGDQGERLYTRNGIFKFNAANEIVTITGNRVLGFGVDDRFQIQRTALVPIQIPLGGTAVAQATENVFLEGTLSPTGDLADTAERIQTGILGDGQYAAPTAPASVDFALAPNVVGAVTTGTSQPGGGMTGGDTYEYRFVWQSPDSLAGLDESVPSDVVTATVNPADGSIDLSNVPVDPVPSVADGGPYTTIRIYRRNAAGPAEFRYIDEIPWDAGTYLDTMSDVAASTQPILNETVLTGNYRYYVTFASAPGGPGSGIESRPAELSDPVNVTNGRVLVDDIPQTDPLNPDHDMWQVRRIYRRNLSTDDSEYRFVAEIPNADQDWSITDSLSDEAIAGSETLDLDGPKILPSTRLVDVMRRDGPVYEEVFEEGTLQFAGRKGGRQLGMKELEITDQTTVQELIDFMDEAMGIQAPDADPMNPIPPDSGSGSNPGGMVTADGRILFTSNNGVDNAIDIGLSDMQIVTDSGTQNVNLPWGSIQSAVGESAATDFLVYDSLGIPLRVRLTAVLEETDGSSTTYRWFAESPDNDPADGAETAVGTGQITFDGEGNFVAATQSSVSIERRNVSSASPLEFELDFSQLSGLASDDSNLAVTRQDGFPPGSLTSFIVGEEGTIRGVFSNGAMRDLAQLRLARFANPAGLEQRGENLYSEGINSGLPVEGDPGQQGIGTIVAGALELSNTDVGSSLIDLILASTMYRGNTRVISTAQQMIDELLSLRR